MTIYGSKFDSATNSQSVRTIRGFLCPSECASLVTLIDRIGFQEQYTGDGRLIRSRAQFEDRGWANLIWDRLKSSLVPLTEIYTFGFSPEPELAFPLESYTAVGLNKRFRCYKYGPNEEFRRHQDFAHEFSDRKRTFITVLVYLNDGYRGGETSFDGCCVQPELGLLAMFPHELEHQGCRVISGVKYSLRTDVVYESSRGLPTSTSG